MDRGDDDCSWVGAPPWLQPMKRRHSLEDSGNAHGTCIPHPLPLWWRVVLREWIEEAVLRRGRGGGRSGPIVVGKVCGLIDHWVFVGSEGSQVSVGSIGPTTAQGSWRIIGRPRASH
ncbi:hypothetical protein RvY_11092 [Ramazzottius varieornatus]|uniref:Uncharacterized protein n=1 Tax=Ramazzottius varieornatus TaxID=947166 RepID=A0A1D1VKF1_RAMVA|nr:hypothetical protein RvY_11092 [Ramazzottius varieornatus]